MDTITTRESVYGFIATDPVLKPTQNDGVRFYARFGQVPSIPLDGGGFEDGEPIYHNLVAYDRMAELAHERFQKGDRFIAQGYTHSYTHTVDGQEVEDQEFRASRIAHDTAMTNYAVDRGPGRATGRESGHTTATEFAGADPSEPAPARAPRGRGGRTTTSGRKLADIGAGSAGAPAQAGDDIPF